MEQELKQLTADADTAFNAGETAKASALYQQVLEQDPNSVAAHYGIGTIALQDKDLQKSVEHLKRAAELEPEAVDIAFNLATCLFVGGNRVGALVQLERAAKYCLDDPVFCSRIAEMSIRLGEPAAAVTIMSRLKALTPDHQLIIANAHGVLGNWREAIGILKNLQKSLPENAQIAQKLALAAGQLRDYPFAISSYQNYLRLITPSSNDYLRFADLLLIAQNAKRCDQALDQALALGEDSAELYVLRARVARLHGDYEAVNTALEQALDRQANHGQAWAIKAELADQARLPEFIAKLREQIENEKDVTQLNHHLQALLNYSLADMCDRQADYECATKALRSANKLQNVALALTNTSYSKDATEQQFDELIENYSASVFESKDVAIDSSEKQITPIFIVGMARSGTTLVERILGQNPHVFNAGEQEAMEFVATHYHHQIKNDRLPKPVELTTEQRAAMRVMYLEKLPDISKPIFTDKLPHNFRQVGLILQLFPEARIIQMHRSMPDVCLSIYSHPFAAGHNYATHWPDLMHFYSQAERLMAHWSSVDSTRVMDLNYEDLAENPEVYAKQIVEFCGFEWQQSYLDFHQSTTQSFTFSEMQVRQPISATRIDRWRNYLPYLPELAEFEEK
ncbi:MAG: tetratricopeptide (TPR) repeat protein [Arenicella sp.]